MKVCTGCGAEKELDAFHRAKKNKDGRRAICKECRKGESSDPAIKTYQAAYRDAHREELNTYFRDYYKNNRGKANAHGAKRRAAKRNATTEWSELKDIQEIYKLARLITEVSEEAHEVDHCIPLAGADVCGLHTLDNLTIISKKDNLIKSNRTGDYFYA